MYTIDLPMKVQPIPRSTRKKLAEAGFRVSVSTKRGKLVIGGADVTQFVCTVDRTRTSLEVRVTVFFVGGRFEILTFDHDGDLARSQFGPVDKMPPPPPTDRQLLAGQYSGVPVGEA